MVTKFLLFCENFFFKLKITDTHYIFVIGNTKKVKELNLESKDFGFCVKLPIKAIRNNLKISSIVSMERKRIAGKKMFMSLKMVF